jgi:hypothetical protein
VRLAFTTFATVLALSNVAYSQSLDELAATGCGVRTSLESWFPGDFDDEHRVKVPYLVLQCDDGAIYACTVTIEKTLDQAREVGLISNQCLRITSQGNN